MWLKAPCWSTAPHSHRLPRSRRRQRTSTQAPTRGCTPTTPTTAAARPPPPRPLVLHPLEHHATTFNRPLCVNSKKPQKSISTAQMRSAPPSGSVGRQRRRVGLGGGPGRQPRRRSSPSRIGRRQLEGSTGRDVHLAEAADLVLTGTVVPEALLRLLKCCLARLLFAGDVRSPTSRLGGGAAELVDAVRCSGGENGREGGVAVGGRPKELHWERGKGYSIGVVDDGL